jgi:hypothetical protein
MRVALGSLTDGFVISPVGVASSKVVYELA